jgi:hypothetical protein
MGAKRSDVSYTEGTLMSALANRQRRVRLKGRENGRIMVGEQTLCEGA